MKRATSQRSETQGPRRWRLRARLPPAQPAGAPRTPAPHQGRPPARGPLTYRASLLVAIPDPAFSQGPNYRKSRDHHFRSHDPHFRPALTAEPVASAAVTVTVVSAGLVFGDLGVRAVWGAAWRAGAPFPCFSPRAEARSAVRKPFRMRPRGAAGRAVRLEAARFSPPRTRRDRGQPRFSERARATWALRGGPEGTRASGLPPL